MGKEWAVRMVAGYLSHGMREAALAYAQGYSDADWSATCAELMAKAEDMADERRRDA